MCIDESAVLLQSQIQWPGGRDLDLHLKLAVNDGGKSNFFDFPMEVRGSLLRVRRDCGLRRGLRALRRRGGDDAGQR